MGIPMLKIRRLVRPSCLVHLGVRDKRWVSEIDLSQPRHETAFWWGHNGPVMSQLTNPIKWPSYPLLELIRIYMRINTSNKESMTQICRRSINVQLCLIFLYISIWIESIYGWHALFRIANNCHGVTITTHAVKRHYLIWMTMMTMTTYDTSMSRWTRQRIHNVSGIGPWTFRYPKFIFRLANHTCLKPYWQSNSPQNRTV